MKSVYNWKMGSFARGVDANDAVKELERIEKKYGSVTAENILKAATPKNSLFHRLFEWDDSEAARLYRLSQARSILNNIEVVVIADGEPRRISAYETVSRPEGRVYKSIKDFTPDDVMQVREGAIREFNYWKNKLSFYKEYSTAVRRIDDVIEALHE